MAWDLTRSFVLMRFSLSDRVVSDPKQFGLVDRPLEFYAAVDAMDDVEECMDWIVRGSHPLTGWRLFSRSQPKESGEVVQLVTGFEPLLIKGEAISYARSAEADLFSVVDLPRVFSRYPQAPEALIERLRGRI